MKMNRFLGRKNFFLNVIIFTLHHGDCNFPTIQHEVIKITLTAATSQLEMNLWISSFFIFILRYELQQIIDSQEIIECHRSHSVFSHFSQNETVMFAIKNAITFLFSSNIYLV